MSCAARRASHVHSRYHVNNETRSDLGSWKSAPPSPLFAPAPVQTGHVHALVFVSRLSALVAGRSRPFARSRLSTGNVAVKRIFVAASISHVSQYFHLGGKRMHHVRVKSLSVGQVTEENFLRAHREGAGRSRPETMHSRFASTKTMIPNDSEIERANQKYAHSSNARPYEHN